MALWRPGSGRVGVSLGAHLPTVPRVGDAADDAGPDDAGPDDGPAAPSEAEQAAWHAGIEEGRRQERQSLAALDLDGLLAAVWARGYAARDSHAPDAEAAR